MIEEILPSTKTRVRILETIYNYREINLTNLIKKSKSSPNIVLSYVNNLVHHNILHEKRIGGKKKTHLRMLSPRFDNENAVVLFSLLENNKKALFLNTYPTIGKVLSHIEKVKRITCIILFGSFARFSPSEDSDIDLLIVGNLQKKEISEIRESLVTMEKEVSIKIETIKQFTSNIKKPLYQNILKEHVIITGSQNFISLLQKLM